MWLPLEENSEMTLAAGTGLSSRWLLGFRSGIGVRAVEEVAATGVVVATSDRWLKKPACVDEVVVVVVLEVLSMGSDLVVKMLVKIPSALRSGLYLFVVVEG